VFPFVDEIEAQLDVENGEIQTSWSDYRLTPINPLPTFTHQDMGVNENATLNTRFYASMAEQAYLANPPTYFQIPSGLTNPNVGGDSWFEEVLDEPIRYRLLNEFTRDNLIVYEPMLDDDIYQAPTYIVFKGTQTWFDRFRDINIAYDYATTSRISGFTTELASIYNLLHQYIQDLGRPIHIIGHSLGFYFGLHLLQMLHQKEAPNLDMIEGTYRLTGFNPLILYDEAVQFFQSEAMRAYAQSHIEIHTINYDFLSPFLYRNGVGKVFSYQNIYPSDITFTDMILGNWLVQLLPIGTDSTAYFEAYRVQTNHSLSSFYANANGLEPYKLIHYLDLVPINNITIQTVKAIDITKALESESTVQQHLALHDYGTDYDVAGGSVEKVDYPHGTHIDTQYNWDISIASYVNVVREIDGVKYVSFYYNIAPKSNPERSRNRFIIYVGNNEYLIAMSKATIFKLKRSEDQTDIGGVLHTGLQLPSILATDSYTNFTNANNGSGTENDNQVRMKFKLGDQAINAYASALLQAHGNNRRTTDNLTPLGPQNPYGTHQLAHWMWEQNPTLGAGEVRGDIGYVNIYCKNTAFGSTYEDQYLFTVSNQTLAMSLDQAGQNPPNGAWESQPGISMTDNNISPDEHIYKIVYDSTYDYYYITNTEPMDGTIYQSIGANGSGIYMPGAAWNVRQYQTHHITAEQVAGQSLVSNGIPDLKYELRTDGVQKIMYAQYNDYTKNNYYGAVMTEEDGFHFANSSDNKTYEFYFKFLTNPP